MAKKKKIPKRHKATKAQKALKIVGIDTLISIGRQHLEAMKKSNPMRHYPKLKGRGRPTKLKTWEMTTILTNGAVAVRSGLKATNEQAAKRAQAILKKRFHGKRVREVLLDDGK